MTDYPDRTLAISRQHLPDAMPDKRFDACDHFDSFALIEIEHALDEAFGIDLPDGFLVDHPTPALAAQAIERMMR